MIKKKIYHPPYLHTVKMRRALLNTISGEEFKPTITESDEEAV